MPYTLAELWIYPVKSLGGIRLNEAVVTRRGLAHDRRFLLVDEAGRFLTQREWPELAWLQPALVGDFLQIDDRRGRRPPLRVPLVPPDSPEQIDVTIWDDSVRAQPVSPVADRWFSEALGRRCRLVFMPESASRPVDPRYARTPEDLNSFSDGYPFLLLSQASLDGLNARLAEPVGMRRFRPNLVVAGTEAHAEDEWAEFRVGGTTFYGVKPCGRCVMTTIDPDTTQAGPEPLRTLARYRTQDRKVCFGQNLLVAEPGGTLQPGDGVEVIRQRHPAVPA